MLGLRRTLFAVVAALAIPLAASAAEKETATVEGEVGFHGKLVAEGKVSFHPAKGRPVVAPLKGGSYSAKRVPVGEVRVTVGAKACPPSTPPRTPPPCGSGSARGRTPSPSSCRSRDTGPPGP